MDQCNYNNDTLNSTTKKNYQEMNKDTKETQKPKTNKKKRNNICKNKCRFFDERQAFSSIYQESEQILEILNNSHFDDDDYNDDDYDHIEHKIQYVYKKNKVMIKTVPNTVKGERIYGLKYKTVKTTINCVAEKKYKVGCGTESKNTFLLKLGQVKYKNHVAKITDKETIYDPINDKLFFNTIEWIKFLDNHNLYIL